MLYFLKTHGNNFGLILFFLFLLFKMFKNCIFNDQIEFENQLKVISKIQGSQFFISKQGKLFLFT